MQRAVSDTKTDRKLEDKMLAAADDPQRANVIQKTRTFKRSWLELAEALTEVIESGAWKGWGYRGFDDYCKKELQITPNTAAKLTGSFRFLKKTAPTIIERSHHDTSADVPDVRAVEFVQRAQERGAADEDTMAEIRRAAFDEQAKMPLLTRRFKSVAFPVSEADEENRLVGQLNGTAKKLAALIADPNLPVGHDIAVQVDEALRVLLNALEPKLN